MNEIDPLVAQYQHEKSRPREAEALQTLRKVASLVKPIMRQRGWRVGILTEFWPPEKNLLGLNWNRGEKICLRLRYPYDERQFIPLEEVVDTMLHELCHNVHGPHNEAFHNLWNQLRDEHEQLIRKGYTGEGFLSAGRTLGGARIPKHEARRLARLAAEKRRTLTAGSGQKLGGVPVRRGEDIRRVIADAAQRRINITRGCGVGADREKSIIEETNNSGFKTKADEEDANEDAIMLAYIDLIQEEEKEKYGDAYVAPSSANPAGSRGLSVQPHKEARNLRPQNAPSTESRRNSTLVDLTDSDDMEFPENSWKCPICTLINPGTFLCCDACSCEKPSLPAPKENPKASNRASTNQQASNPLKKKSTVDQIIALEKAQPKKPERPLGWLCHNCGNFMENEWWTCAACGTMKQMS